jgi:hypothetical protein
VEIIKELRKEHGPVKWDMAPTRWRLHRSWAELWKRTQDACAERGLWMLEVRAPLADALPDIWNIFTALSPRATDGEPFQHCVVSLGERVIHDPHPSGAGVVVTPDKPGTYTFFIAQDPGNW